MRLQFEVARRLLAKAGADDYSRADQRIANLPTKTSVYTTEHEIEAACRTAAAVNVPAARRSGPRAVDRNLNSQIPADPTVFSERAMAFCRPRWLGRTQATE